GWYKGKTQPQNLQTTRVPEYDASYDDNDDLTIIYEEIKYGGNTVQFGFVGESGQLLVLLMDTLVLDTQKVFETKG
ncbi:hypothetical protein JVW21_20985, partial [Vibrio cholerae O1]